MTDLIVLAFDTPDGAQQARTQMEGFEEGALVGINDMVVVERDANGKVNLNQTRRHAGRKIVGGTFWGMLIGLIFFVPGLGAAIGAAVGVGLSYFRDFGISDDFMKEIADTIKPGTSALFLLTTGADPGQILLRLKPLGGKIIHTTMTDAETEMLTRSYGEQ
jgi:uncharacterized membrane protein